MVNEQMLTASNNDLIAIRSYQGNQAEIGSVVIGGAMGVSQDYYAPFAQWLAEQGWRVTTFDYRGYGASVSTSNMRGINADLFDWATDYDSAVEHAYAALPNKPLFLLGHSLGAQLVGLLKTKSKISGLLSVAAGNGYWRESNPRIKYFSLYLWWVLVPLVTRLFGYFPGRKLKKIGDLPSRVIMQWRKWCLHPKYCVGAEGEAVRLRYADATFPITALYITDDELMTLRSTQSLVDLYENAQCDVRQLNPSDFGLQRLGHFGVFRGKQSSKLWPLLARWLHSSLPMANSTVTFATEISHFPA